MNYHRNYFLGWIFWNHKNVDFLFEDNDGISIKYRSERGTRGLDSFYGYQLVELIFIFEIERKLGTQINDQAWERIESVRELLQAIKDQQQIV